MAGFDGRFFGKMAGFLSRTGHQFGQCFQWFKCGDGRYGHFYGQETGYSARNRPAHVERWPFLQLKTGKPAIITGHHRPKTGHRP
jgi:hypothetical protein